MSDIVKRRTKATTLIRDRQDINLCSIRHLTLLALTAVLLGGTVYSVLYNTYLDTSDPLLAHLPHKLSATHYFASKQNALNVLFIKRAWGWTAAVFLASYLTAPPRVRSRSSALRRFVLLTLLWALFTRWFFGPALLDRLTLLSGGDCLLILPGADAPFPVPHAHCHAHTALGPHTHPDLFADTPSAWARDAAATVGWTGVPRIRSGHDVSGHVYLLTQAALFLADSLRPALGTPRASFFHVAALGAHIALLALWLFALATTGVYFHSPFEKLTGYLLGVAAFALSQLV